MMNHPELQYTPVMAEIVRFTIAVDSDVAEVYQRMADMAGQSRARCIGDWLASTMEGAQFVMQKTLESKGLPGRVLAEMKAFTESMGPSEIGVASAGADRIPRERNRAAPAAAPSSHTGLNSPAKTLMTAGKESDSPVVGVPGKPYSALHPITRERVLLQAGEYFGPDGTVRVMKDLGKGKRK